VSSARPTSRLVARIVVAGVDEAPQQAGGAAEVGFELLLGEVLGGLVTRVSGR
jgi:hypothetical protein